MKADEFIRWNEHPTEHARRAYQDGYYIEAMQVLHGFIEAKLRDLLMVSRHGNIASGYEAVWDVTQEMTLNVLAKALFVSGKLSQDEYSDLKAFNSTRNKLVHRFYWEPYNKDYQGVPKDDYEKVFQVGSALADLLDNKAGAMISRRKTKT